MSRRYVIVGAGAVGAALAAGLHDAGRPVVLVSRGSTYQAIREHGLRYTHAGLTRTLDVPVIADPGDIELSRDDVLVFAVKTQDAADALQTWAHRPVTTPDGARTAGATVPAVTLQNGLETERIALRHFARVVSGTVLIAARHVVAGEVRVFNAPKVGQLVLGAHPSAAASPGAADVAHEVAADARAADWLVHTTARPQRWKAWKLLQSTTFAASVFAGSEQQIDRLRAAARAEAARVLSVAGLEPADPDSELTFDRTQAAPADDPEYVPGQLSTWQSFARGAGSEIDYLNGEVVLRAREQGSDAPVNAAIQQVLARAAIDGAPPGTVPVDEVFALAIPLTKGAAA